MTSDNNKEKKIMEIIISARKSGDSSMMDLVDEVMGESFEDKLFEKIKNFNDNEIEKLFREYVVNTKPNKIIEELIKKLERRKKMSGEYAMDMDEVIQLIDQHFRRVL